MLRYLSIFLISLSLPAHAQEAQVNMLAQAESFLTNEDTARAVRTFQQVLNQYPDSYPAALRLTEVYYLNEQYREAIQYSYVTEDILNRYIDSTRSQPDISDRDIQRARRYSHDLADIQMLKGKIRLKQNRPVDALHELNQALVHSDQPADVYIDIGLANISLGEYDAARKAFHTSLAIDRGNKGALFNLGNLYYTLKEYDSARHYYRETYEIYPSFKWPLLYLGNIATSDMEYEEAIDYYSSFIKIDSASEEAHYRRAVLYSEMRQWESAINDWNKVLSIDPQESEAWRNRGLAYFQIQKYEESLDDFNRAIELKEEPYSYVNRGYTQYLLKNYEEALSDLSIGLEGLDEYALGYYLRALTQLKLKNKESACSDLQRALENGFDENEIRDKKLRKTCL